MEGRRPLPPDPSSLDGFTNNVDRLTVGPDYARGVLETGGDGGQAGGQPAAAEQAAALRLGTGERARRWRPARSTFVTTFGPKLYRRPLTPAEIARYMDLFSKVGRDRLQDLRPLGDA